MKSYEEKRQLFYWDRRLFHSPVLERINLGEKKSGGGDVGRLQPREKKLPRKTQSEQMGDGTLRAQQLKMKENFYLRGQ